ncbi:MAG: MgtC/SapB family protein [Halanaeroarchaeum sp.]
MVSPATDLVLPIEVTQILIALALGMFIGLEREWSQKPAGIRTFALASILGTILTQVDQLICTGPGCLPILTGLGALLVVLLSVLLALNGLWDRDQSMYLTTSVSLFVTYGVGVLVGLNHLLPATVVAVMSSILLVFKRELHGFAWGLSHTELRSAVEFAILAFVVYPLLPGAPVEIPGSGVAVELRVVWLMVVSVAAIGIANYAVVKTYGAGAVAITGFFGGLASSTAVVGAMLEDANRNRVATDYAIAAVLLAIAAMAMRNLVLVVVFTYPRVPLALVAPLAVVILGGVAFGVREAESTADVELDMENPFSLRYALGFGAIFAVVLVIGTVLQQETGALGLLLTTFVSGFVSSAGATTSAVVLFRAGTIDTATVTEAVLLATAASVLVKAGLVATSQNRAFARGVVLRVAALLLGAGLVALVTVV